MCRLREADSLGKDAFREEYAPAILRFTITGLSPEAVRESCFQTEKWYPGKPE